jgi:putative flippase GtrA
MAVEILRFIGSGLVAFPVGLGVSALCHEVLGWSKEAATAAAFITLLLLNFALGRLFVFRSTGRITQQLPRFVAVALVMRSCEYLLSLLLQKRMPYLLAIAAALCVSSLLKFVLYRTWVFPVTHHPVMSKDSGR